VLFETDFIRAVCNSRSSCWAALESFVDSLTDVRMGTATAVNVAATANVSISSMSEKPRASWFAIRRMPTN
jgi:hypothetical protein